MKDPNVIFASFATRSILPKPGEKPYGTEGKDRAVARQRQKLSNTQKKELEKLRKQVDSLQEQLQSANETITSLTAANKQEAACLNRTIHALEEDLTKARAAASQAEEQLSSIASYVVCDEYKPKFLSSYLAAQNFPQSRTAALRVIVSDDSLTQKQRRKLAFEITQNDQARYREPLKTFVKPVKNELAIARDENLEPEHVRWYRSEDSDDPVLLLKRVAVLVDATLEEQERARKMLALFYGWRDFELSIRSTVLEREHTFARLRGFKKRSLEEVEKIVDQCAAAHPTR